MFARIEDITERDIPESDSLSDYDGLKIVRETVDYDTIEGRYHPSLDWVETTSADVSNDQIYDPETDTFSSEPSLPSLSISLSKSQIANDGSDEVVVTVTVGGVRSWDPADWSGKLVVSGTEFPATYTTTSAVVETVTTTESAGSIIEIRANAEGLQQAESQVEVVSP